MPHSLRDPAQRLPNPRMSAGTRRLRVVPQPPSGQHDQRGGCQDRDCRPDEQRGSPWCCSYWPRRRRGERLPLGILVRAVSGRRPQRPSAVDGPQNRRRTRRRRGNTEGANPRAPNGARRTRRTAFVLETSLGVLDGTGPHCGPPFGTKRPQVQILSPRLTSSQVTALRGPPRPRPSSARGNNKEH